MKPYFPIVPDFGHFLVQHTMVLIAWYLPNVNVNEKCGATPAGKQAKRIIPVTLYRW
jgi:hypothetical protein